MFDKNLFNEYRATQQKVQENQFVIPEDIPRQERTAFHGAAAAAAKAGKTSFSFAGKKHPVTMKKDTANAIADQKEGYYKDMEIKKQDKEMGAKPVPAKKKKNGETATMNPKMDTAKSGSKGSEMEQKESVHENVKMHMSMATAHSQHGNAHESEVTNGGHDDHDYAGGAHHDAADAHKAAAEVHKKHGGDSSQYKAAAKKANSATVNAKDQASSAGSFKKVAKPKVSIGGPSPKKESAIRTALKNVLAEKENHSPNKDKAEDPDDAFKGAGAKQMKKDLEGPIVDIEKQSHDDAAKAGRAGPNMKGRNNDNKQGDKKIVNPVAGVVTKEKTEMNVQKTLKAYQSMYEADANVTSRHDVMHDNKAKAIAYVKKKAGSNVTVKHHGMTPNGDHDISVTGHPKHVMKFVNHHEDEKYSHDHAGHAQYKKDFG